MSETENKPLEYTRLGRKKFWSLYGPKIERLDEEIIQPILNEFDAVVTDKWPTGENVCYFSINENDFELELDVIKASRLVAQMEVRNYAAGGYEKVGVVSALLGTDRHRLHVDRVQNTLKSILHRAMGIAE